MNVIDQFPPLTCTHTQVHTHLFTHTSGPHPHVSAHTAQEPLPTHPFSLNLLQEAWFPFGHTVTPLLGSRARWKACLPHSRARAQG